MDQFSKLFWRTDDGSRETMRQSAGGGQALVDGSPMVVRGPRRLSGEWVRFVHRIMPPTPVVGLRAVNATGSIWFAPSECYPGNVVGLGMSAWECRPLAPVSPHRPGRAKERSAWTERSAIGKAGSNPCELDGSLHCRLFTASRCVFDRGRSKVGPNVDADQCRCRVDGSQLRFLRRCRSCKPVDAPTRLSNGSMAHADR